MLRILLPLFLLCSSFAFGKVTFVRMLYLRYEMDALQNQGYRIIDIGMVSPHPTNQEYTYVKIIYE